MNTETIALLIPIVSVVVTGLVIWAIVYYRHRNRAKLQETIQAAIAQGNQLTPELLEQISGPKPSSERDLRRGIIFLAVGIAFVIFGVFIGFEDTDALYPMVGIGTFPILIGLGYLVMHKLTRTEG